MKLIAATGIFLITITAANADEFSEVMESATELYGEGDIAGAKQELSYAIKLLDQIKSESLSKYLPDALPGWEKQDSDDEGTGMAMAMFGGGTSAAAKYTNESGDLTITLVANSPMVGSIAAMVTGLTSMGGGRPIRIQRTQFGNNDGELQGVVDNRVLISVTGDASVESKKAYLEEMDFQALRDF